ncbi:L,D-transpeptidase family protein [Tropicibacter naphthalenivorans]|uniref:Murein L,D-transpeptidase n=1 Tax=Tropicibacter naphthalenivorans TaxID=441103 RepID=A0A0N7M0H0_9RHOB|nr:L,D-transpeptidase family protein [Tropicibacter naphthalenivorans]CUH80441.1 murein L,D-transpeptidase [Tropicibacter naphthalenivorans]SMC86324.1 Murein L,D-transpeptidase YcbB/YkuD [Tropicibacter naphthalenivorans]
MISFQRPSRTRALKAAVAAGALFLASGAAAQQGDSALTFQVTAFKQAVAENIGADEQIAAFYRARNFEPIWTSGSDADRARRLALIEAFSLSDDHGLPRGRFDANALKARMAQAQTGRDRGLLEIELTNTFLQFAHDIQTGVLEPGKVVPAIKRVIPRRDAAELLTRLVDEDPTAVMRSLSPSSPEYARLMRAKLRLEHRIAHGGWGPTVPGGSLKPGQSGNAVVALRNRLTAMGYLQPSLTQTYDSRIEAAVREFQEDMGLTADGVAGGSTMTALNKSPEERLKSIMVAMERERWLNLPDGLGQRHVRVNLVNFHAQIFDDNKLTFETKSVIGQNKSTHETPEFSDTMEHMVINPSWYVPRSIIVSEYLPAMRANPYAAGHLEVIDARGRVVPRSNGFSQYSSRSFPFNMRQPPGPRNALGSVKFMFPNKYNIYLHDTPSQDLFAREVRTFSHGCIRLDDPHDFAYTLLAKQESDPVNYFQSILRTGQETHVDLVEPVPVHLIYRTAFTSAKGQMNYRNDVYGRDAQLWRALEREGVALRVGRNS